MISQECLRMQNNMYSSASKEKQDDLDFIEREEFERLLAEKTTAVTDKLKVYEERLSERLNTYDINAIKDVSADLNTPAKKQAFIENYIFDNFLGKIEIAKVLRSGFSFSKNTEAFYKRMALLKTPGNKLFLKGMSESYTNRTRP